MAGPDAYDRGRHDGAPDDRAPGEHDRDRGWSLSQRVAVRAVLAALVVLAAMLAALVLELEDVRGDLDDQSLQTQARQVLRHLTIGAGGDPVFDPPAAIAALYADPAGNEAFALLDEAGTFLLGSAGVRAPLSELLPDQDTRTSADADPHGLGDLGRPFRGHAAGRPVTGTGFRVQVDGRPLILQVGQGNDHPDVLADSLIEEFLENAAWWVIGSFTVLIGVTLWTIRSGLAPLRRLSARAARIGPTTSGVRLGRKAGGDGMGGDDLPQEVRPLVAAIDGALDRLDGALEKQRAFIADAAHELRTPIAALRARMEATLPPDQAARLAPDFDRLSRLAGQLLRLAEVDTLGVAAEERADLAAIARDVLAEMAPLAVQNHRSLALDGADRVITVRGKRELLSRLLRNLVENALAHVPADGNVTVKVVPGSSLLSGSEDGPELIVDDDGPGVPPERRAQIFERFWRADRRRGDGAGLGLAIVQRIADAHGAGVSVEESPEGGARFRLRFPPVRDSGGYRGS
jgi:signal transduction histidine kinase